MKGIMYIMSRKILITFVGMKDPYPQNDETPGPILSLLKTRDFDEIYALCTGASYIERAKDLEREMLEEKIAGKLNIVDFPIEDVISYEEIWVHLAATLESIDIAMPARSNEWSFLLDSGTPQMKSCLFLAGRTGRFDVRLLQGIPPYYAQGTYRVRDITGATGSLPIRQFQSHPRPDTRILFQGEVSAFEIEQPVAEEPSVIARSKAMRDALSRAARAGKYNEPVLILGETGTGKTILAWSIHASGSRADAPFIELNCSAIPEGLAESMLFGHERGAFTGADRTKSGAMRSADKGTLFLDEVGDLPLIVQAKLLKAIEEKSFFPVGADKPVTVDVRIIAATNKNLRQRIQDGMFRRDLYERLNVIAITLPPLRERPEDVEALIDKTLHAWNREYNEHKRLSGPARELLKRYSWPGNVRELLNAIRSAAAIAPIDEILPEYLPDDVCIQSEPAPEVASPSLPLPKEGIDLRARLLQVEWEYFSKALRASDGNREAAARLLGMTGHSLRKALKERFRSFVQNEGWGEE